MNNQMSITITAPDLQGLTVKVKELSDKLSGKAAIATMPQATGALPVMPAQPVQPVAPQPGPQPSSAPPIAPQPPIGAVPTSAPQYTVEQLQMAAAPLMDAGKQNELIALLNRFGVNAMTELPKEQYGAFAMALREMGAQL